MSARLSFTTVFLATWLVASSALAHDLMTSTGFTFDPQVGDMMTTTFCGGFADDGDMCDGGSDAYDDCYYLQVDGLQWSGMPGTTTLSLGDRQIDLASAGVPTGSGLVAERHIYVPMTSPGYARYVDLVSNPTSAPIDTTIAITGNLGSDGSTMIFHTSSGDTTLTNDDTWFSTDDVDGSIDPSLAHVFQGDGAMMPVSSVSLSFDNINYSWMVTIPAGGRVGIMHFAVQEMDQATATATAEYIAAAPDDVLVGIDDWSSDIINWGLASSGVCTGADGLACSSLAGTSGICHGGRCCTGCWDGTRCLTGRTPAACGIAGGACVHCASVAFCSSAMCTAGVCNGSPCDDGESCTTDTCDEATDSCGHTVTSGCIIGGECVGDGVHHVAYPCLVCDTSRSASDWSTEPTGTSCGSARCADGHLFAAGTCDATGLCDAPHPTVCDSMACNADGMTCAPPCTATSCPAGQLCGLLHHCVPALSNGVDCTMDGECASGHCTDGVCCDGTCDGTCESCVLSGREGMCKPIPAGSDPDAECSGAETCDGHGACALPGTDAGPRDGGVHGDGGPAHDGGPTSDGGTMNDGGTEPPPAQSCACNAPGRSAARAPLALGVLGLLALLVSRRRRAW